MKIDQFENTSLIILCGGKSKRFDDQIKALQLYNTRTLISHTLDKFAAYFNKIYISVSNTDVLVLVRAELLTNFSKDIFHKISIIKDSQERDHSPLFGVLDILYQIQTSSAIVIPIDRPLITINDLLILEKQIFLSNSVLTTFSIKKKWITSDFFMIHLNKPEILSEIYKLMKGRKRLTDLIRAVPSLRLIQINEISTLINVNTPKQLNNIQSLKEIHNLNIVEHFTVYPLMYIRNSEKIGICHKFEMEILSWINSALISQILEHVMRDFISESPAESEKCNLVKFEKYLD